jgi:tripartite-type tricarboxylate transporter receptor subunit TctC
MFLFALCSQAMAEGFPSRAMRIVVPFTAGGTTDVTARTFAQELARVTNNFVVVENRVGGLMTLGVNHMLQQPRDGHTLLITTNAITAARHFSANNFSDRLIPVGYLTESAMVLLVSNNVNTSNLTEFISLLRTDGSDLNYATVGGGTLQMMSSLFFKETGVSMTGVAYSGASPAMVDLLAGRIHMMFDSTIISSQHVRSGNVRALAVSSATRSRLLPNIPTMQEQGVPISFAASQLLVVPSDTPIEIRQRLNALINRTLQDPVTIERFAALGVDNIIGNDLGIAESRYNAEISTWNNVFSRQ